MTKTLPNTATQRRTVTSTKMSLADINLNLAKSSANITQPKIEKELLNIQVATPISIPATKKIIENFGKYIDDLNNTMLKGEDTQAISEATTVSKIKFIDDLLDTVTQNNLRVDIMEKKIAGTMNRVDRLLVNKIDEHYNVIIEDKKVSYGTRRERVQGLIGTKKLEADYIDNTLVNNIEKQVGQYNNKDYQMGLGSIAIVNNGLDYYVTVKKTVLIDTLFNGEEDTNLLDGTKAVYEVHPGEIWRDYNDPDLKAQRKAILSKAQRQFTVLRNIMLAGIEFKRGARKDMLNAISKIYINTYNQISGNTVNELTKNGLGFSKVSDNKVARLFGIYN